MKFLSSVGEVINGMERMKKSRVGLLNYNLHFKPASPLTHSICIW